MSMPLLEPPDTHLLSAAIGWLELGNRKEALAELEGLSPDARNHPDVLEVKWLIHAESREWGAALEVARALIATAPERSSGWLHQAYALRRVPEGGLEAAWDALFPVANKFPREGTIPYNLACYACQMGQMEAARDWLQVAVGASTREQIKKMALADEDLEPLWEEVRGWKG